MAKAAAQQLSSKSTRPPIVVVMGHIDHGKTKILDWCRKTKVVESESGGITQHIGAYEVRHKSKKITFIDTPGHEAFSKLRSRGAKIADIAILVVAAEEGVKPQTKEAIEIIRQNNIPFVVAINKIDKPEANPDKVKQELAQENVLVESYGGSVPSVEISAKMGQNMDGLLEIILLMAELEELRADPQKPAEGIVLEANVDPKRGITSTLLIRDGTFKKNKILAIGRNIESIKILEDFLGQPITEAGPSSPVLVTGLTAVPTVGDTFYSFPDKRQAEEFIASLPPEETQKEIKTASRSNEKKPIFNIIIKTDVIGSKEALEESFKKLEQDWVGINIIRSEIGDINESDVKLALATKLVTIVGFKVKVDSSVREFAKNNNIHIVTGEVIYNIIDEVKEKALEIIPPEVKRIDLGRAKILKIFKKSGSKQIVGGRVEDGAIKKGVAVEIKRNKEIVGRGAILQLQKDKRDAEEVEKGNEFGMMIESNVNIAEGDVIDIFQEEKIKRNF